MVVKRYIRSELSPETVRSKLLHSPDARPSSPRFRRRGYGIIQMMEKGTTLTTAFDAIEADSSHARVLMDPFQRPRYGTWGGRSAPGWPTLVASRRRPPFRIIPNQIVGCRLLGARPHPLRRRSSRDSAVIISVAE